MSDPNALLAAILAHPDEDTPRLAYADWLDEHSEAESDRARAEFIRLQIEQARGISDARRRKAVEARCAELERNRRPRWLQPVWKAVGVGDVVPEFRRGFVEQIHGPSDAPTWVVPFLMLYPVQEVEFQGHPTVPDSDAWAELAASPLLAGVRGLCFESLSVPVARAFFPSPHLTGLRSLDAGWAPAESVEAIVQSPTANHLRELRLSSGYSGTATPGSGLRAVLSGTWPALEELRLHQLVMDDGGLQQLIAAGRGWKRLQVSSDDITSTGVRAAVEVALPDGPESVAVATEVS